MVLLELAALVVRALVAAAGVGSPEAMVDLAGIGVSRNTPQEVPYRGAVVQYRPSTDWSLGPRHLLATNLATAAALARNASAQGADIVVLPEYGLTGPDLSDDRHTFKELCQLVPKPGEGRPPCDQTEASEVVRALSCLAAELRTYLVADLAELGAEDLGTEEPADDFTAYNTQVAFDRRGNVVARYRKKHLFCEPQFACGDEDDSTAVFETDFGVTFSLQVCFDVLYTSPGLNNIVSRGISDVVMSTAWIDGFPFLSAVQAFSGFSQGLSVNLLVSNLFRPEKGEMGSGIFQMDPKLNPLYTYDSTLTEPIVMVSTLKTFTLRNDDNILNSTINQSWECDNDCFDGNSKQGQSTPQYSPAFAPDTHYMIYENLSEYASVNLLQEDIWSNQTKFANICHEGFCCKAKFSVANTKATGINKLVAYNGIVAKGNGKYKMWTQTCAVLYCSSDHINSCGHFYAPQFNVTTGLKLLEISAEFSTAYVFPSIFKLDFKLANAEDWSFTPPNDASVSSLATRGAVEDILAATLLGRCYERDGGEM